MLVRFQKGLFLVCCLQSTYYKTDYAERRWLNWNGFTSMPSRVHFSLQTEQEITRTTTQSKYNEQGTRCRGRRQQRTLVPGHMTKHTHGKEWFVTQCSYTPTNKTIFGCQSLHQMIGPFRAEFTSLRTLVRPVVWYTFYRLEVTVVDLHRNLQVVEPTLKIQYKYVHF